MEFGKKKVQIIDKSLLKKKVVEENNRLSRENSTLSKTIESKKKEIKSLDKELKSFQKEKVSIQKEIDKDNEMKSLLGEKILSLSTDKKIAEMELGDMISQVKASDNILIGAEKELNKIEKRIEYLEKKKKEYTGIQSRINKAKQELKGVNLDIKASEKALDDMHKEFNGESKQQELQAASMKRKLKDEIKSLTKEVEDLAIANKVLQDESAKLSVDKVNSIAAMEREKHSLKEDMLELEASMKARINDESDKILKLGNIIEINSKKAEAMKALSDKAEKDLERARKKYANWRVNVAEEVANMKLKGKLETIDKAGLADVLK